MSFLEEEHEHCRSTCQTLQKFAIRGHPLRPSALGLELRHQPRPHEGERALVAEQRSKQVQTEDIGGKRDVIGLEGLSKNEAPLPKRPRTTRSPSSKSPPLSHTRLSPSWFGGPFRSWACRQQPTAYPSRRHADPCLWTTSVSTSTVLLSTAGTSRGQREHAVRTLGRPQGPPSHTGPPSS